MIRNAIIVTFAIVANRGAVVIAGIVIANQLGANALAAFAFAHVTATSFSNIATLGMQNALPRYFAHLQVDTSIDSLSHTIMAVLFAVVGLIIAATLVLVFPAELIGLPGPATREFLATLLVIIGINNLCIGAINGLERFSHVSRTTLVQGGLLLVSVVIAIWFMRVEIALWGYVAATIIATSILFPPIFWTIIGRLRVQGAVLNWQIVSDVAKFCGPLFLVTVLTNSGLWLAGRSLLEQEDGVQAFAEFTVGLQWFGLASLASGVIARVVLPRLTRSAYLQDEVDKQRTVWQGLAISFSSTITVFIGVFILSDFIIRLYGSELSSAREVLLYFTVAAVLASPINVISSALVAEHQQMTVLFTVALWWVTLMMLLLFITDMGAYRTTLAIVVSYAVYAAVSIITGHRHGIFRDVRSL
jgi:O-antigen/teichoic acid export membrane protein